MVAGIWRNTVVAHALMNETDSMYAPTSEQLTERRLNRNVEVI